VVYTSIVLIVLSAAALASGILRARKRRWIAAAVFGSAAVLLFGLFNALLMSHAAAIRRARERAEKRAATPQATVKEILERHFEISRGRKKRLVPKDLETDALEREVAALGEDTVLQIREAMASLAPQYHDLLVGLLAWRAKERSDEAAREYLRELAESGHLRAVEYLGRASSTDADLQLLQAAIEGGTDLRYAALRSLGETRRPEAVPILAPYLDDEDDAVRWNAANSLAKIGTQEAGRLLIARLAKEDPQGSISYWAVLGGLMEMGYTPALETHERELASLLAGEERSSREVGQIACAVSRIPDKSRQEIMCLAMLEVPRLRNVAVTNLEGVGPLRHDTVCALLQVLCDESVEGGFRYIAARVLNKGTDHHVELGWTCDEDNVDRLCKEWQERLGDKIQEDE